MKLLKCSVILAISAVSFAACVNGSLLRRRRSERCSAEGDNALDKKILVVDDSATVRQQVRAALADTGFEIVEAADGIEGLDAIAARQDLAAVVCDVNMPRLGGLQLLETLSAQGKVPGLPVVMLTTEGQPALMQRAKAAGARGWLVKPFKPATLVATLRKLTA
ncbi:MAG: Chemotaxis regulator - transmits chemoreceptor signals to flagelllar motor component CheY [Polyangiaceae bacterium]|nr:Chemotaxis regulator - transmits chemoreceptor signals to flagelllar motor component CheY [Polyangiaceae bacterium]